MKRAGAPVDSVAGKPLSRRLSAVEKLMAAGHDRSRAENRRDGRPELVMSGLHNLVFAAGTAVPMPRWYPLTWHMSSAPPHTHA
jgi:hypothetical protein